MTLTYVNKNQKLPPLVFTADARRSAMLRVPSARKSGPVRARNLPGAAEWILLACTGGRVRRAVGMVVAKR